MRLSLHVGLCAVIGSAILVIGATPASAETYSYDALGRLIQVVTDDGHTITYAYDAAGNRITVSIS